MEIFFQAPTGLLIRIRTSTTRTFKGWTVLQESLWFRGSKTMKICLFRIEFFSFVTHIYLALKMQSTWNICWPALLMVFFWTSTLLKCSNALSNTKWVTENLCSCVKVWACVSIPFSTNAWCLVIDLSLLYLLSSNRRVKLSPTTCVASLYFWNKFFITQVQNHMGG